MTETQHKYLRLNIPEEIDYVASMRETQDKKGGGLMVYGQRDGVLMEMVENSNPDVMQCRVKVEKIVIDILLVYLDTSDVERNRKHRASIAGILDKMQEEENWILLGDFNGHLGFIGEQEVDGNGRMVFGLMEEYNLVLLNADDRCEGSITRSFRGEKSAIDFMLVNAKLYENFKSLKIDENKTYYDLSDHCLLETVFRWERQRIQRRNTRQVDAKYYYSVDENLKEKFLEELERELEEGEMQGRLNLHEIITKKSEEVLKRKFKRSIINTGQVNKIEPIWITEEIKREIKTRREINRMGRVADIEQKDTIWHRYQMQRKKVKGMVAEAKKLSERKLANEIKKETDGRGKMWKHIQKLRGTLKKQQEICILDEEGRELEKENIPDAMKSGWRRVYQANENRIEEGWNEDEKSRYRLEKYKDKPIREGMNMLRLEDFRNRGNLDVKYKMEEVRILKEDIIKGIKKIKAGKQPGPDGLRGEIYRWMIGSERCIEALKQTFQKVLSEGKPLEKWRKSKTVMVPKVKKPTIVQFRPIALTDMDYKLFMSIMKEKMIDHLELNKEINDLQMGFTKGRRLDDNLFLLRYCVASSRRYGRDLIVLAVDFAKAFDSIDRLALVETLKEYKCDPKLIEVMVRLYENDETTMRVNDIEVGNMKIKNGIRQGCSGSPQLFLMVVNRIIKRLQGTGKGFRVRGIKIPVLFYADDGLLLANDMEEMREMMEMLEVVAKEVGMKINKEKCSCIIFSRQKVEVERREIHGVKVVEAMKYLGVLINNNFNDCFAEHKKRKIEMARKLANMTCSVVQRACDRLVIGKVYWKHVVVPSLLIGGGVVTWKKNELDQLQRIENGVWRMILGAPGYTPIVCLRGDIGAATMVERDAKNKLLYEKYLMDNKNKLLKTVYENAIEMERQGWVKSVRGYREVLAVSSDTLRNRSKEEIKALIREWGSYVWQQEKEEKTSLELYKRFKQEIKEEKIYENDFGSRILFKCRANVLALNWRKRFTGGTIGCELCGGREETLEHFLRECPALLEVRETCGYQGMDMGELLFGMEECSVEEIRNRREFLGKMWSMRERRVGADR